MQITTLSDTHGLHHQLQLPGGDLLIHAGDVCNRGTQEEATNFIDWFEKQSYTYKIFIAGNHDFFFENFTQQEIQDILPKNIFYLNDTGIEIDGINIWGSPITPEFHNWAFNRKRGEEINKHWQLIPNNTDILITHGPAFGILDKTMHNLNVGCEKLLKAVKNIQPKYHVFGHIHEAFGSLNEKETTYINTSSLDLFYKIRNTPFFHFTF
ncbi:metallophosphatase domain-containing protein [Flavobacterium cyclinae]|uniref:metallophosphatase domain-containing protein n=1 Tax=Flavobacterium cyclinae TaxID=2895947 RepID=UPI001E47545C|nr:metallophosphatase domain-containing protein [Flavobacterium cyclinae]UGS19883.1 metallophosphatase domain-containing protein [Flavobacterium cyclinae]